MKILVIATTFPRWKNDTEPVFVYDLSKLLAKKGHDIVCLVPHSYGAKEKEKIEGLKIIRFSYFYPKRLQKLCYNGGILPNLKKSFLAKLQVPLLLYSEYRCIKRIIKKEKTELVHAHWIIPQGFLGAIFKKLHNTPLIITAHAGDIFPLKNKFFRLIAKFSLDNCDFCTVNSSATKKAVLSVAKIKNIKIIPMGVDISSFNPNKRDRNIKKKFKIKEQFLLTIGRLAEKKGIKYLIKAMPFVLKKFPNLKLMIIGDGPEKESLINLSRELKIDNNTIFAGKIPNKLLSGYYATADIFILPSIIAKSGDTEGLGVVLLEAIASGTPVIGSNVGGIPDIIKNGKTGLLVEQKNPEQLADAIIKLLTNKKLRKKLIIEAKKHIEKNYSWGIVAKEFEKIYKETI